MIYCNRVFKHVAVNLLVFILMIPSYSSAQDDVSPLWKEVGRWDIRVDQTLDYGCFAVLIESDEAFRLGVDNLDSTLYAILAKEGWDSIETGKTYDISLEFDSEGAWEISSYGIDFESIRGLAFEVSDFLFIEEMMERHRMYVRYNGQQIMQMSMQGSIAALNALDECLEVFDSDSDSNPQNPDPFASSTSDPFAPTY